MPVRPHNKSGLLTMWPWGSCSDHRRVGRTVVMLRNASSLPANTVPDQGAEGPSRLLGRGRLRVEVSLPKSLTWCWKWWHKYLFSPEAASMGHTSSILQFPSASWQDPVPSPLWIAPKCSQKLRSSNRVSTFPHHKCAISNGLHTSSTELQVVVQPPMLSGFLGWTPPGPTPALYKVTLVGEEY